MKEPLGALRRRLNRSRSNGSLPTARLRREQNAYEPAPETRFYLIHGAGRSRPAIPCCTDESAMAVPPKSRALEGSLARTRQVKLPAQQGCNHPSNRRGERLPNRTLAVNCSGQTTAACRGAACRGYTERPGRSLRPRLSSQVVVFSRLLVWGSVSRYKKEVHPDTQTLTTPQNDICCLQTRQ